MTLKAPARLARAVSIDELSTLGRRRIPRVAFDYMDGGAESEHGIARNRAAFDAITLTPRYFVDVTSRTTNVEIFGRRCAYPFGVAPLGLAGLVWAGADQALAVAAYERALPFVLSTAATMTIEAAAALVPGNLWFQLYVMNDQKITEDLLNRARNAGIEVIVVTVDTPVPGKRERDLRNRFTLPIQPGLKTTLDVVCHPRWALAMMRHGQPQFANLAPYAKTRQTHAQTLAEFMAAQISPSVTWNVIDWIRSIWPGRLVLKGILSAADAVDAVTHRVDAIIVSNHGGRQIDAAPASVEALPAIVDALQGRLPLFIDSGVRRGLDVAKALAIGAQFVFVGRATLYGAAAGGAVGVARALDIIMDEFRDALGQLGCKEVRDLAYLDTNYPRK